MGDSKYTALRKWFHAGVELGEYIGIRFGHLRPDADQPEWCYYLHAEFDGIGAFAEILRRRGVVLKTLPQIKYYPAYSAVVSALKHWPKYFLPRRPLHFKPQERDQQASQETGAPRAVAWHVFDETTTYRVRQDSRKLGLTVNTFLLHYLTRAARALLEDETAPVPWMIPVNMRGGVNQYRDTDNHTSYVGIRVGPQDSAGDIHLKILKALSRGEHWGHWHAFKLGNCLTPSLRRGLVRRGLAMSQWSLGGFSNLGEWDADKSIRVPELAGVWMFCPPALRTQMLAVGCMTFQGRLTLLLQAHADLTTSAATMRSLMERWVGGIQEGLVECAKLPARPLTEAEARAYQLRI